MDDDKGPSASPALPAAPPPPPPPPNPQKQEQHAAPALPGRRQRFDVELRPGETTIVSWKKLLKEAGQGSSSPSRPPPGAEPGLAAPQAGPSGSSSVKAVENDPKEAIPPPNRFSAVVEKIERLYMGNQSDEELNNVPDEDEYDTEDSFIDDTELDEYFQVDNLATKHDGYFVNKGKLEQIEPNTSLNASPKKRRRKDSSITYSERGRNPFSGEHAGMVNMLMKPVVRSAPFTGKKLSSNNQTVDGEHCYEDGKQVKNKQNAPVGSYKRKSTEFTNNLENQAYPNMQYNDALLQSLEPKHFDKHNSGVLQHSDIAHKSRTMNGPYEYVYPASRDKGVSSQLEFQSKKQLNGQNENVAAKVRQKEQYATGEYANTSTSGRVYPMQVMQHSATQVREGAGVQPRGTRLERAIRDLEKIVAECRPPSRELREVDPACQGIRRRLPREVKQKLAKVARLSASQGKFAEYKLIDRLMGIVGHLVQRRTLKRNMKEMVELGLSAKQEKADRLQQIKKEIDEMVRARISYPKSKVTEQQDGSADDFQEVVNYDARRDLNGRYAMDAVLEDKICDLYDLYVEGMDEDKGPQIRKLYVELAGLWPHGYMDNIGVKHAINKSRERKRVLYRQQKVRNEERMKRRRLASAMKGEDNSQLSLAPAAQWSPVVDHAGPAMASLDKPTSSRPLASASKVGDHTSPAIDSAPYQGSKNTESNVS